MYKSAVHPPKPTSANFSTEAVDDLCGTARVFTIHHARAIAAKQTIPLVVRLIFLPAGTCIRG